MLYHIKSRAMLCLLAAMVPGWGGCEEELTGVQGRQTQGSRSGPILLSVDFIDRAPRNTPVMFVTRLANTGDTAQIFNGPPIFEVYVTDSDGDVVWNNLHGFGVPLVGIETPLQPGEVFVQEISWDGRSNEGSPVRPGNYLAFATFWLIDEPDLKTDPSPLLVTD